MANKKTKVFLPSSITCSPKHSLDGVSSNIPAGWQEIDSTYAAQLIKVGSALTEKDQKALETTLSKIETAEKKKSEEWRKEQAKVYAAKENQRSAAVEAAKKLAAANSSKSKYEKDGTRVG